jgi:hypothetical protein
LIRTLFLPRPSRFVSGRFGSGRISDRAAGSTRRVGIVLTVEGEWRRTRLFRAQEQAVVSAIGDTRTMFEARAGRDRAEHEGING